MSAFAVPRKTIEIMRKYDLHFQKKYGQNFLIDPNILEKIVAASQLTSDRYVLEIGPGIGSLTQYLCQSAKKVVAVEIDRNLLPVLDDTLSEFHNVEVVCGDILKTDLNRLVSEMFGENSFSVVANLPYYITTPILMKLLECHLPIDYITIMVQKEVAERMKAAPGSKDYGSLSLAVAYYALPEIVMTVPTSCFIPQPKVESAVIRLTRHTAPPVNVEDEVLLFRIIRAAFNQRRKTLANSLSNSPDIPISKDCLLDCISSLGLSPTVRGESLSLEEFACLSNIVAHQLDCES